MRDYSITKYKGNTHYSVNVTDSYGRQKGSFFRTEQECHKYIYEVWDNEVPKTEKELQEELLHRAVVNCIEIDTQNKYKH
jgi:hypothetical protein